MDRERKKYFIPPNLQDKFLIFGMTIPEFCIVIVLVFLFVNQLTKGRPLFFILPCAAAVLFIRALDSGTNSLHVLTKVFRYYAGQKQYSLRGDENAIYNKRKKNNGRAA
jgi:hypothetical protein